jgi:threonine synthase
VWGAEEQLLAAARGLPAPPVVVLATAHPAKFAEGTPALRRRGLYAGGSEGAAMRPPLPPQLQGLSARPRRCITLELPPTSETGTGTRGLVAVQAVIDAIQAAMQ